MKVLTAVCLSVFWLVPIYGEVIDVDGTTAAFEDAPVGSIEDGWQAHTDPTYGGDCFNDDTHVAEGNQSVMVPGTSEANIIWHDVSLGTSGTYEFMFYDDMVDVGDPDVGKNVRVGLHYQAGPYHAPRLGGFAVEASISENAYVTHRGFSFRASGIRRSLGWHDVVIEWYDDTDPRGAGMTVYVDGQIADEWNDGVVREALCEVLGAPFSTDSPAWIDGIAAAERELIVTGIEELPTDEVRVIFEDSEPPASNYGVVSSPDPGGPFTDDPSAVITDLGEGVIQADVSVDSTAQGFYKGMATP